MSRVYLSCLLFSLLQLLAVPLAAQSSTRSITVTGVAEKELAPDRYTISVAIQAEGKTTELARAEFRKRLEQVRTTFNDMDFPDLTLASGGRTISDNPQINAQQMQIMMMGEGGAEPAAAEAFYVREEFAFQWRAAPQTAQADLEQGLGSLLDRIRAEKLDFAGQMDVNYYPPKAHNLVFGSHSQIQLELRNLRTVALEDAKTQASEIAALAGGKLGRVLEVTLPEEAGYSVNHSHMPGAEPADSPYACKFGSKLKLRTTVRVKFELE
jgi:uncharacterized protein YggE